MKYLLLIVLILVIFWLWRRSRRAEKDASAPPQAPAGHKASQEVTEMVACRVCQVHLPRSEALIGRDSSVYCCQAHRREAEG